MQEGAHSAYGLELSSHERGLVHALAAGEVADLAGERVRASVIRDLALGRRPGFALSPAGLRLKGGTLEGGLDLRDAQLDVPIILDDVLVLPDENARALVLEGCRVDRLVIRNCRIRGEIAASNVGVERDWVVEHSQVAGAVRISRARIAGAMSFCSSSIGDSTDALAAAELSVGGAADLGGVTFNGTVELIGARFRMGFVAKEAVIVGDGAGLILEGGHVVGDLVLDRLTAHASVNLASTRVEGTLSAEEATITHVGGGVDATGLVVGGDLTLDRAVIRGRLVMDGLRTGGSFSARRIDIDGGEIALSAAVARFGGHCRLPSARLVGRMDLQAAQVAGDLLLAGARVFGSDGAVNADGLQVNGQAELSRTMVVGRLSMRQASIRRELSLRDATIKVESGCAIDATGAEFSDDLAMSGRFQTLGGIVCDRARVSGMLDLTGAHVKSAVIARGLPATATTGRNRTLEPNRHRAAAAARLDEVALGFSGLRARHLRMPANAGQRPKGIVDLSDAEVEVYEDTVEIWPPPLHQRSRATDGRDIDHLILDGFSYARLANPDGSGNGRALGTFAAVKRIAWLHGQTREATASGFVVQPWRMLAASFRTAGHEADAEHVRIEMQRRLRQRSYSGPAGRGAAALYDWLTAHGRGPGRAIGLLFAVLLAAAAVFSWAASHCTQSGCRDQSAFMNNQTANLEAGSTAAGQRTPDGFHPVVFALDRVIPFVRFGTARSWHVNMDWAPVARLRVPDIPVFLSGETEKSKLYTTLTVTRGTLLYAFEVLVGLLGLLLCGVIGASLYQRVASGGDGRRRPG